MSTSHVATFRDLTDVLREGHMVYSQAAKRTQGEVRQMFANHGEAKDEQARHLVALCAKHAELAAEPFTVDKGVHRAYAHLHAILRLHPDEELLKEMDEAEHLLATAVAAGGRRASADIQRGLMTLAQRIEHTRAACPFTLEAKPSPAAFPRHGTAGVDRLAVA